MTSEGPLFIEMIGLPGSGKSTILHNTVYTMKKLGYSCHWFRKYIRGRESAFLGSQRFTRTVPARGRLHALSLFMTDYPDLFKAMTAHTQAGAWSLSAFMEFVGFYQIMTLHGSEQDIVICDEGFLQRWVALQGLSPDPALSVVIMPLLPQTDLIVWVDTPIHMALDRAGVRQKRKVPAIYRAEGKNGLDIYHSLAQMHEAVITAAKADGRAVLHLDGAQSPEHLETELADAIKGLLDGLSGGD